MQDFARIAKPLYDLLQVKGSQATHLSPKPIKGKGGQLPSKTPVQWTLEHQEVLEHLTNILSSPPVLAYPIFDLPFVLHTDASAKGLGTVLYQRQGGKLRVVVYGSRILSTAEKNYHLHSGKLEFLALKWAVCKTFRDYLFYAPHLTVYTDNNPLTYVMSTTKLNAVGHRWVAELSDFHFEIRYRPGKVNIDADTLFRLPLDMAEYEAACTEQLSKETVQATWLRSQAAKDKDIADVAMLNLSSGMELHMPESQSTISHEDLKRAQRKNMTINDIIKLKEKYPKLTNQIKGGIRGSVKRLLQDSATTFRCWAFQDNTLSSSGQPVRKIQQDSSAAALNTD